MDGKGAWRDNVFVERLWRSVKYEEVYLRAYDSVAQARTSIDRYLDFYNGRRPHSSLDRRTPDQAYFTPLPIRMAAQPRQTLHLSTRKNCSDNRGHLTVDFACPHCTSRYKLVRVRTEPGLLSLPILYCTVCKESLAQQTGSTR